MSKDWTRSEPKPLRPFFGAADLDDALKGASLELRRGDEPMTEPTKIVDLTHMQGLDPIMRPNLDAGLLAAALGPRAKDYQLVVTLRTPQMLRRVLVETWPCDGPLPERITFDPEMLQDARTTGAAEFGIAVCLAGDVAHEDGWPSSPGAWLARKTFHIGIDRRQTSFAFDELTDEEIKLRKLSKGAAFVVDAEELNAPVQDDQPLARVLVAPSLLDALRSGAIRSAAQEILMAEIIEALLDAKAAEIDPAEPVVEGSGLQRLLEWASDGKEPMPLAEFAEICRTSDRRRALVQHRVELAHKLEALR
ncbi:MAG: hypothetical protein R3D85_10880 [Paracoccaceae bacterium]